MSTDFTRRLAGILRDTAEAHGDAFSSTNGEDPEWPQWYAERMIAALEGTRFLPAISAASLPWLTVEQMVEADRLAVEEFGIELLMMMEHAGSLLAELVMRQAPVGRVSVLAGGGNNGGGGLCAARHLIDRGRDVEIVLATEDTGAAASHHLEILAAMGFVPATLPTGDVAVDALVGYGLSGPLQGRAAELAQWASRHGAISLDFPSGYGFEGAVEPDATLTLALPKEGLRELRPLYLADLGLPQALWQRMGIEYDTLFREGSMAQVVS
jgi:NAD(P)H-hydrate epimerase